MNSRPRDKTIADNPELLKEWDSERNLKLPNEVAFKSNRKYFWKCKLFKHSFTASASNRTAGKGCPICKNKHFISKGEKELLEAVKSLYAGRVEENRKYFNYPYETDIVLPDLGIGIEFNGDYWHSDKVLIAKKGVDSKSWHALKRSNAESLGVDLLFVWERDWTRRRAEILEAIERFLTLGEIDQIFRQLS